MTVKNDKLGNYTDWAPGDILYAPDLNDTFDATIISGEQGLISSGLNTIRTLIDRTVSFSAGYLDCFADAYIDASGRDNTVKNASAVFDTNKYKSVTSSTEPFVVIEATSIADVDDWDINNCDLVKIDTGKWLLSCSTGTDEVKRAQIYKTLFYGTDGSNPRASSTYITGITALKTNVARDVGKYAWLINFYGAQASEAHYYVATATYTFTGSAGNDVSSWSKCTGKQGSTPQPISRWYIPEATLRNNADGDIATSDETGTDLTADEVDAPATFKIMAGGEDYQYAADGRVIAILLSESDFTSSVAESTSYGSYTNTVLDFYSDNSIPVFTALTEDFESLICHTIPTGRFPATISSAICVPLIKDWETGADIQFKLTNATEDSGWLEIMGTTSGRPEMQNFTAFTSEPTSLIVKLIPKSSSPTAGYPSILGAWCIAR